MTVCFLHCAIIVKKNLHFGLICCLVVISWCNFANPSSAAILSVERRNKPHFKFLLTVLPWTLTLNMLPVACRVWAVEIFHLVLQFFWLLHGLTLECICWDVRSWEDGGLVFTHTWMRQISKLLKPELLTLINWSRWWSVNQMRLIISTWPDTGSELCIKRVTGTYLYSCYINSSDRDYWLWAPCSVITNLQFTSLITKYFS